MLYALADSLSALGRDAEAELYYRQLLRVNPTDVSAFLTYGDLLAKNVIALSFFYTHIYTHLHTLVIPMSLNTLEIYDSVLCSVDKVVYLVLYILYSDTVRRYANMYRRTWKIIRFINPAPFHLQIESHRHIVFG